MEETRETKKFLHRKRRLTRHLIRMKTSLPGLLEHAFDQYYESQTLTYLKIEKSVYSLEDLILCLEHEIDEANSMSILNQVAGRVNYVADRLDATESSVYKRARRRRPFRFNLYNFFEQFSDQSENGASSSRQEVSSLSEAYQILDLEEGCHLSELMSTFRRLAKKYHPDARGGDRSDEGELRRVVEAYQIIKESFVD